MTAVLSKNNLVSHANCIAEARYALSEQEQKLILSFISLVQPKDQDFYAYEIPLQDLVSVINVNKKSAVRELDKITDKLMTRMLKIPLGGDDFLKTHWVSDILFTNGILKVFFSPNLKPYLLNLQGYFKSYRLNLIVQFSGKYTIRIYQLLKVNEYKKNATYELYELREILGIEPHKYRRYVDFRNWVLNPAKKQLETKYITDDETNDYYKSDVSFDLTTRRTGRKISHLTFIIKQQPTQPVPKIKVEDPKPKETDNPAINPHQNSKTYQAIIALGIQQKKAISLIEEYGEDKINEKLAFLKEYQSQKSIKSPAGFIIKALENNFLSPEMQEKKKAEARKRKAQLALEQKTRFEAAVKQTRLDYLETHSTPQKNEVRNAFENSSFYQRKFGHDSMLDYLYSETDTLEEALAIPEFEESLQSFIIWQYVPNTEHLRNLEAWKGWEEKETI